MSRVLKAKSSQISPFILNFTVWFLINKNLSFSFVQFEGWSDKNLFRRPCIEVKLYCGQLSQDLRSRPVTPLLTQASLTVNFLINPNCLLIC